MSRDSRVQDRRRNDRSRNRDRSRDRDRRSRRNGRGKNRSCCSSCIISIVVLFVITLGAIYGGGWFAWHTYAEPNVGVSFNAALGLIGSTYIAKDKDIVTNPFEEKDLDGFYSGLSQALFLDKDVNLKESLAEVLESFVVKLTEKEETPESSSSEISTEEESSTTEPKTTTGNEALDNFLKSLKFDFSRLKDYEDEYATPQILSLTDKQTAAFIDNTIDLALSSEEIKNKISDKPYISNVTLQNVVDIPQIVIASETINGLKQKALTLTVRVNLRETVKEVAESIHPALKAVTFILPKKLYATMTIYPDDYMKEAKVKINSFSEEKMNNVYSIANFFLKDSSYGSINGILQMVNQKALEAIEKVQSIVPVEFLETGSVSMSPIKALMNVLGATELTETQFFCMVRDLCLPTFDDVKEHLGFDSEITYDEIEDYLHASREEVVAEISAKYALDGGYLTADNMLDKLKGVGGESSELVDHVRLANLDFTSESYNQTAAKVNLKYVGLASLISGYLNSSEDVTTDLKFEIINSMYDKPTQTLSMVLKIGVLEIMQEKMGEGSIFAGFLGQIIPQDIYIKANICLATDDTSPATIEINNRDVEGTIDILNTIGSLTASMGTSLGLDYTSLGTTVATKVRDGLKELNDKLGTQILFEQTVVYLPSIYDIMADKILYSDEVDADNLTAAQVYSVFKGACVVDTHIRGVNKADDLTSFVDVVNTDYSITNAAYQIKAPVTSSDPTIVDQLKELGNADTGTGKPKYDEAINGSDLAARWNSSTIADKAQRMLEEFNPYALEDEAATLFEGAFNVSADGVSDITLNKVIVESSHEIRLVYSCVYNTDSETKYKNALPNFVINVLLDKDKISGSDPCVDVTINTMDSTQLNNFALICQRLGISSFNMDNIKSSTDSAVKSGLQSLFEKIEVSFDDVNGKIHFGSMFEIAYKIKGADIETAFADESLTDASAVDVADMIGALHTPLNILGQTIGEEFDSSTGVTVDATSNPGHTYIKATLTARNLFDSINKHSMATLDIGLKPGSHPTLTQTMLVSFNNSTYEEINASYLATLSNMYGTTTKDYIAVSFAIAKDDLKYESELLPDNIYLSLALENSNAGDTLISYNNLTKREVIVLKALAGSSASAAFDIYSPTGVKAQMKTHIDSVVLISSVTPPAIITIGDVLARGAGVIGEDIVSSAISGNYVINYEYIP